MASDIFTTLYLNDVVELMDEEVKFADNDKVYIQSHAKLSETDFKRGLPLT
jgi:hypothetical protein